jgi:RNA polymerase-binding transcription factor DksA
VSDAEHELLKENTEQGEEIALLRRLLARTTRAAIDAQDRADGRHEHWLDDALAEAEAYL